MDIKEVRANAKERMKGFCRVCPVCDGRACAGETPGMGGIGTGSAFKNNVAALAGVRLNMRLIHEVKKPVTETEVLGFRLRLPVLAAPIGGTSFNMGGALSEAEYARAIVSGCREAGIVGCVGDGAPDELHEAGNAAITAEGGWGIPFIKPWEGEELECKMCRAAATGTRVLGMDIDAAGLIALARMGRPVSPKTCAELAAIVDRSHELGMKFVLKGIMTVEDAIAAERAGICVPERCRSGECGWCRSRLLSGSVYVPARTDGRRRADVAFGYIHPCASFAMSDLVLDVPNGTLR